MMIFASDLDRTLIYSKRALESLGTPYQNSMVAVEQKNGEFVSFMTENSFSRLKKIADEILFIPVTTRTYEQYQRVFIFNQEEVQVTYSITSNGADIHYKGELLKDWQEFVHNRMKNECKSFEEMCDKVKTYALEGNLKLVEELFFYYILEQPLSITLKEELVGIASSYGWKVSLQGRKLYFMPAPVCKGEAIKYIANREGMDIIIGSGDSILDAPLLEQSTTGIIASHGELIHEEITKKHMVTEQKGALAGEEIVTYVSTKLTESLIRMRK